MTVVAILDPAMVIYVTKVCWTKMSKLRPKASGFRLKYPSMGGK